MSEEIYSISYMSESKLHQEKGPIEDQISEIIKTAQRNNSKANVTGALLYRRGTFVQVLEGPEKAVKEIFEAIKSDPRHTDIHVIDQEPIEERNFGEWSMALAGIDQDLEPTIEGILVRPEDIKASSAGKDIIRVLHNLLLHSERLKL